MAVGTIDEPGRSGVQRGVEQTGLRRLQLAAVASPTLGIEQQIVAAQYLCDVGLERDEVRRVLRITADGNRARHVPVNQAERTAEEIDPGGDDRRAHTVVVEDDRLDEIVGVAFVVRGVDDPPGARRRLDDIEMLHAAIDLSQYRVERVLERAVKRVTLCGLELFQVRKHSLPAIRTAVGALKVSHDVLAREDGLGEIVRNHEVPAL